MHILDIFFPKRCVGCGRFGRYICTYCSAQLSYIAGNDHICPVCERPAIDGITHPRCRGRYAPERLVSFFHYKGIVRKIITAIKYRFVSDIAGEIIATIDERSLLVFSQLSTSHVVIVPVPLHPLRLRARGFNQAEILGRLLGVRLNLPVSQDILKRVKSTPPQVVMKKKEDRLVNMKGVFAIGDIRRMKNVQTVVLFDDVFTTGATMRAATHVLKKAGVKTVWAVTLAR